MGTLGRFRVEAWVEKTLPTLREHLRDIENLSAKVPTRR